MIREAIAVILLLIILAAAVIDIGTVTRKSEELEQGIENAKELYAEGDKEGAMRLVLSSQKVWQDWGCYAHVLLRHAEEVDSLNDEYYELLEKLEKDEATPTAFDRLICSIESLAEKGKLTLGSIF